ncbi:PLDc N-terminal domain-containing protein [Arthrobacter sp. I2-34]|uniref:PLDc N-terminal domain-containing protein n=1 Tax=Arthrobacter hankyongi TaxID=2904801 RepID=A0ABS9LA98_9MICC|nr:PLDc N-terminal domain-containing protein [Arthrobacter hankyongi]MCG2623595.1 PLDc N-terminal domain-containing protein [Arthrobacter hankyongi]
MPLDHVFWLGGAVFGAVFALLLASGSLVSMLRSDGRGRRARAAWAAVIVLLPVLGPVLWLAVAGGRAPSPEAADGGPADAPITPGIQLMQSVVPD